MPLTMFIGRMYNPRMRHAKANFIVSVMAILALMAATMMLHPSCTRGITAGHMLIAGCDVSP
jgi:hypothetical protein